MPVTPFAEQERELLIELAYLFAHREERERALASRLADGSAAATKAHRDAATRAHETHAAALAAALAEHAKSRAEAEADFNEKLESATRWMKSDLGGFRQKTQSIARTITSRKEEAEWLTEAMLESGHARINPAFEAARKSIAQRTADFDALEADAAAALAAARHAPLPESESAEPSAGRAPAPSLDSACESLRAAAVRLRGIVKPVWLTPLSIMGFVILGAVAGAALGGGKGWLDPLHAWRNALAGAGIGAGAVLVLMLAFRFLARRRVPRAAAAMRDALAAARTAATASLRAAEAERDARLAELAQVTAKEHAAARATVSTLEAEVQKRTGAAEPELRAKHERIITRVRADRDRVLAEIDRTLADRRAALDTELSQSARAADETLEPVKVSLERADRTDRAELESTWAARLSDALRKLDGLNQAADEISPDWSSPRWENPSPASGTPPGVRYGSLRIDLAALPGGLSADPRLAVPGQTVRTLPLMLDLLGRGSVLIRASPEQRSAALDSLNNIALRLLTGLPPGKARFTFVDPVGLGQSFAGLMHISDYEEAIVGERIWTDARHIEQRLTDLTEHMETVIQKYLRNEYETIQAYNVEAGEVAEPYRFLVIADFPASITETAARKLASIAASGARCGVFTLIVSTQAPAPASVRAATPDPAGISWADIERHGTVITLGPVGARLAREPFAPWPLELEPPPDEARTTRLLHRIGEFVKDSTLVRVPFSLVEPPAGQLWTADATHEVRLPLGRAGAKKLQHFSLGRGTAQHALVAGRTGSGKSTLLHVLITTAALWYSPDEIELYLVDFKKGVEFKTYAAHRLPHARVVAVESEREFGVSVLRRLDAELTRRGTLFRDSGVQDLPAYRRSRAPGDAPMPRILLIVDEFQEFFVEDDRLAQDAALLLDRLVRQGRAFGIHIVLGSQTLGGAYSLARATLGQMAVRIALQCSEADAMLIMSEDNPAARLLERPGEAIYNDSSGTLEGNSPFQVVWLPDTERDERLDRAGEHYDAARRPRPAQIVFEGHVPADIVSNRLLAEQVEGRGHPRPVPTLWLGDPLAIKDPTGITLRPQSAANALFVGNQEDTAAAMISGAILSLATWRREPSSPASTPTITILDATPSDLPHAELLAGLVRSLGQAARLAGPREAPEALRTLTTEIEKRDASGSASHPPALLVVFGLHRFRELRRSDDFSFSSEADKGETPAQLFARIFRAGPSVGVHTLAWCDTTANVERTLERSALREFNWRILSQMSAADSTHLADGPHASTLGPNRALLYSDDTGAFEKFRPYAAPAREWLDAVLRPSERGL